MHDTRTAAHKRAVGRRIYYTRQDARSDALNYNGRFHKPTRQHSTITGPSSVKSEQRNEPRLVGVYEGWSDSPSHLYGRKRLHQGGQARLHGRFFNGLLGRGLASPMKGDLDSRSYGADLSLTGLLPCVDQVRSPGPV